MQFRQLLFPAYARLTLASQRAARRTSERGQLFLAGTVFSAALGIDTDLTLVYQLFALLLSMTLISRITVRFQQPNIQAQRILPKYATAHEPFVYLIRVTNRGDRVEKNLTISDIPETINPVIDDFLNKKEPYEHTRNAWDRLISWHRFTWLQRLRTGIVIGKTTVATLPVKAEKNIKIEATPLRRGVATLSSINLQKPDPFGLNYHVKSIHKREQIIVLPKRYPIRKSSSL
ncbi:MAG: hypothetical protein OEZ23_01060, partial [Gammaproteobacteria bacterium]|nr:hypothetical protein [Gammaproteobacteria bacterium]